MTTKSNSDSNFQITISIPHKDDKHADAIRDAFRILAWQNVIEQAKNLPANKGQRIDYLALYEEFYAAWQKSKYFTMKLTELQKEAAELGYSQALLNDIRKEYYKSRSERRKEAEHSAPKSNNSDHDFEEEFYQMEPSPF